MPDLLLYLIVLLSFGVSATFVFVFVKHYLLQKLAMQRLPTPGITEIGLRNSAQPSQFHKIVSLLLSYTRLGRDEVLKEQFRRDLRRAGYFGPDALEVFVFGRLATSVGLAVVAFFLAQFFTELPLLGKVILTLVGGIVGHFSTQVFLARRRRALIKRFRLLFPNVLDLLVVCVDAGLTLEIAFVRVRSEVLKQDREFGYNLEMMGAEMRAGRSMIEALDTMSDRLGLEEARSFVSILRQSLELGSDVSEALRVFSDEMRDKRLLRAEEAANKLSVRMVLPLGLFIFPVVLLVILLPVIIKLMAVLH